MKTVDLKDEYRTETDEDVYSEDTHYGGSGSFSDEYVKWLESKLKNNEVLDLVSECDHDYEHVHTNWYKCKKCNYVTPFNSVH